MRGWWLFSVGVSLGCSPLVSDEDASSDVSDSSGSGANTSTGGQSTPGNPSSPVTTANPTAPNPTGNPPMPVTTATASGTEGSTTTGFGSDGVVTGDVDTGPTGFDLPPEPHCMPLELFGPLIVTHPGGWAAFSSCDGASYILQTAGEPAFLTTEEVTPLSMQYGQALFGMPGAAATGMGPCCEGQAGQCLTVDVQAADVQLEESLAYAAELFAGLDPGCVGVRLQVVE